MTTIAMTTVYDDDDDHSQNLSSTGSKGIGSEQQSPCIRYPWHKWLPLSLFRTLNRQTTAFDYRAPTTMCVPYAHTQKTINTRICIGVVLFYLLCTWRILSSQVCESFPFDVGYSDAPLREYIFSLRLVLLDRRRKRVYLICAFVRIYGTQLASGSSTQPFSTCARTRHRADALD